ncbi:MAG: sigma-70 family RNA polymerase sigma factor [Candidatus Dormiibacterota bacterium]
MGGEAQEVGSGADSVVTLPGLHRGEDDGIVQLLANRDPKGIDRLYERYGGLAYAIGLRVLGDRTAAEDVVQESFLAIWRRSETFDPRRGGLRPWVCTIVHHRALDRLRGSRNVRRRDIPLDGAAPGDSPSDPWEGVSDGLVREAVRGALAQLPPEQRETIELAYFAGLSQSEISSRMNLPLGTVKGRARLAMRRLHQLLAGSAAQEWLS